MEKKDNFPLISICIVTLNPGGKFSRTIESIYSQSYKNYEVIIKDSNSTEIDKGIIDNNTTMYVSNDKGIYDAMNFCIEKANGLYILFLNAGDLFAHNFVLQDFYTFISTKKTHDIIYSNYMRDGVTFRFPKKMSLFNLYRKPLCHQALFVKKILYKNFGNFKLEYNIAADYESEVRFMINKAKFLHFDYTTTIYEPGGYSENKKNFLQGYNQILKVRKLYFRLYYLYSMYSVLTLEKYRRYLYFYGKNNSN